jgi:hypothetical protein
MSYSIPILRRKVAFVQWQGDALARGDLDWHPPAQSKEAEFSTEKKKKRRSPSF